LLLPISLKNQLLMALRAVFWSLRSVPCRDMRQETSPLSRSRSDLATFSKALLAHDIELRSMAAQHHLREGCATHEPPRLLKGPPGPRRPFLRSVGPVPGSGPCGALEALQRWQPRGAGAAGQAQRGRSFLALAAPESDSPTDAAGILWHLAGILADGLGKSFGGRLTAHAEGLPEVGPTHTSGARSCDRLTQLLLCAPSPLLDVRHLLRPLNLARTAHRRRRS